MKKKALKELKPRYKSERIVFNNLTKGDFPYPEAFQGITDFFSTPERVIDRMQELEVGLWYEQLR